MKGMGEKLKKARRRKGMTQQEIADQLHLHRTTYTKYETHDVEPSLITLCRLAEILDVTVAELLEEKK